ncbi:N-acetyl-gamma-glutamyl-phosphate reductase [Methylobacillus rhizosphaerae]|uniref:N-acetyl-gamma-glutamyl-phosphate reductase n=1 Tax=Methylobacillus rhizosphaerae TaxID=551994 RepID=A0A238ZSR0_9PROT|nr:N-acetyl-gamma-glutamyl-phosphate reductase [Methylobacillus rhizosphaerae]SNR86172.1 N-acetyl-gamma-glutamyl-phosphate reductase [Methylobacillus rhizosphaerae]
MVTAAQLLRRIGGLPVKVGVAGGTGYVGAELVRLLAEHPHVRLHAVTSGGSIGKCVNEHYPYIPKYLNLRFVDIDDPVLLECDVVIFSTPLGTIMRYARSFLERGIRVIDLSPDFSLENQEVWKSRFALEHSSPELIPSTIFGLPEINRAAIKKALLLNSPSSYSTAIILGVLPLLAPGKMKEESLVADIVVGMTAHGRVMSHTAMFAEHSDTMQAFDVDFPLARTETESVISRIHGKRIELTCIPHSAPLITGLHATLYLKVDPEIDLFKLYKEFYRKEIFVEVLPAGCVPETRNVRGSNYCKIAPHRQKDGAAVILVALDNLIKGAAGQAIQNLNIMFGLNESDGLHAIDTDPKGHTA